MWNDPKLVQDAVSVTICDYALFQSDSSAITEEKDDELDCMFDAGKLDFMAMPGRALDKAEEIARRVWLAGWTVVHHQHLPKWLRDNDFLIKGHRPPLNSFYACFKSIFRIHTETGNIWTHLLGMFVDLARYRSSVINGAGCIKILVINSFYIWTQLLRGIIILFHL